MDGSCATLIARPLLSEALRQILAGVVVVTHWPGVGLYQPCRLFLQAGGEVVVTEFAEAPAGK